MLHSVEGDLFESKEKYIVHQCNCVTTRAAHLAYHMFKQFPYADVYSPRAGKGGDAAHADSVLDPEAELQPYEDKPGDIIIRGNGEDQRYVIALLGQYFPGAVRYPDSKKDGVKARQKYFYHGLWKIAQIPSLESVAFPYGIGCGAAGGDWNIYYRILQNFAGYLDGKADVYIYRLDGV
jgi:O-acetyl-ADP-ribose deacetylase (regulator of RNase III)